jgi:hypothetical protein
MRSLLAHHAQHGIEVAASLGSSAVQQSSKAFTQLSKEVAAVCALMQDSHCMMIFDQA